MRNLLLLLLFISNFAFAQKKYYPQLNSRSNVELFLSSNVANTTYFVDGVELLKAKRGTVLIDKEVHTVIARPEGYIEKESYIQPPYKGNQATISFTFMIQDKIDYQSNATVANSNAAGNNSGNNSNSNSAKAAPISEVDTNIPSVTESYPYRFALIIGNEDYSSFQTDLTGEIDVDFAKKDAEVFKEYANKTLGIPENNINLLTNATSGQMKQALAKINVIAEKTSGKAELYFYYAGHGLPDEVTKEAYLIPVDVSGTNVGYGIKVTDVYKTLTEHPTERITVFLDACFSGGARNQGLLSARGVKIKPKEEQLGGKLIVFSASSGDQSSLPYKEKGHGMFTYYLLKKLQDSRGKLTYSEMADYLKEKVSLNSVIVNSKEQDPQTNISPSAADKWMDWKF